MKYFLANWKMYINHEESLELASKIKDLRYDSSQIDVAVFPNALAFDPVKRVLVETGVGVGAQNVAWVPMGAYTGAISAHLFKEAGAKYALVGHSERRHIFNESGEATYKKMEACLKEGIIPVLCIGETAEDLENSKREYRLSKQLMKALDGLTLVADQPFLVAYEPVWAISSAGEGKACSPQEAASVHERIIEELKKYTDQKIPVLYGGSTKPENALSYLQQDNISGLLVGHSSTKYDSFGSILETFNQAL